MDHLTWYALLIPVPNKDAKSIAKTLIDRVITTFGIPEEIHSDGGTGFENKLIYALQMELGFHKTKTISSAAARKFGLRTSPLHHAMSVGNKNWASLGRFL